MLLPYVPALNAKRIVLASGSPRRHELLTKQLGLKVEVGASGAQQTADPDDEACARPERGNGAARSTARVRHAQRRWS